METKILDLRVSLTTINIKRFSAALTTYVEEYLDRETACNVRAVLSEVITNIYEHAYGSTLKAQKDYSCPYDIIVFYNEQKNKLTFRITDYGAGISNIRLAMSPHTVIVDNETRLTLGFTIMKALVKNLKVSSTIDSSTIIEFEVDTCRGKNKQNN